MAVAGLDAQRVAEVIVTLADGSERRGSGYRTAAGTVLTAAHVVEQAAGISVRFDAGRDTEWQAGARVVWVSPGVDTAVLGFDAPAGEPSVSAVLFGRVAEIDVEITCSTMGFPRFKLRRSGKGLAQYRDSCHRLGRIAGLSHRKEGSLEIRVDAPDRDPDRVRSPWEGMSGAPVFAGRVMIGVVSAHHRPDGLGTLTASRVDRWHDRIGAGALAELRGVLAFPQARAGLVEVTPARPGRPDGVHDVLLSFHPDDLSAAEQLADQLEAYGVAPRLERRPPGAPVRGVVERAFMTAGAIAVLIGAAGLPAQQAEEMRDALDRSIRRHSDIRVLPVLLPGADPASLPSLLARHLASDFRSQLDDPAATQALVAGIRGEPPRRQRVRLPDSPAPYPSLRAFTTAEADLFFGRSAETGDLTGRVRSSPFTAVVGASGSGKSSLIMAGLLASLGDDWLACLTVPGRYPLRSLAHAVAVAHSSADVLAAGRDLEAGFAASPDEFAKTAATIAGPHRTFLLVVDQFEEVFAPGAADPSAFIAALCHAAREAAGAVHIVITLRADFVEPCLDYGELRSLLEANVFLLGSLDDAGLREAVLQPAQRAGALFERGLVERIVTDMRGRRGALPLLQTSLAGLWQRRRGEWLTHEGYKATGGIGGALNQLADDLYANLSPSDRALARLLFLRLVNIGENTMYTRRRVSRGDLDFVSAEPRQIDGLLRQLSGQNVRLVSVDDTTVELTHEALIDNWETLREWLRQDDADLRTHRELTEDTHRWDTQDRDDSFLYRGLRLAAIVDWAARNTERMSRLESAFVLAGQSVQDSADAREQSDRTLARAGQAVFELDSSPEEAVLLAYSAGAEAGDTPLVQRSLFRVAAEAKIRQILRGHEDRISSVAWHPDGAIVATGSYDGTVRLWDLRAGTAPTVLRGHSDSVTCVRFDHSGRRLASGSWDATARVWDVASLAETAALQGHTSWVSSVSWSPSDRYLATGSQDHTARIWELSTGQTVCELAGHEEWVRSAEWHPDERHLLTGGYDHVAKLWEFPSGRELAALAGHEAAVPAVAWSKDGTQALACSEDGTVSLWDMAERTMLSRVHVHTSPVYCVAWAPAGRRAAVGSEDGRVRVFDFDTGALLETLHGHRGWVSSVAWSPDGTTLISGSEDATARVASARSGLPSRELGRHDAWVSGLSWHGRHAATSGADGLVRIWDTESDSEVARLAIAPAGTAVAWSPHGNLVAAGSSEGVVTVWDARTWNVVFSDHQQHGDRITAVKWRPDQSLLASASYDNTAVLWNTRTWRADRSVQAENWVVDVAWSPDGADLLLALWESDAVIWRTAAAQDEQEFRPLSGHTTSLHAADWSGSGRMALTSSGDGTARVWDPATGSQLRLLGAGEAHSAAFHPVRQQVVTGSRDGGVRLWDVRTGADLLVTYQHPNSVLAAVWNPAGTQILTACEDGVIRIWPGNTAPIMDDLRQRIRRLFPPGELGQRFPHLAEPDRGHTTAR